MQSPIFEPRRETARRDRLIARQDLTLFHEAVALVYQFRYHEAQRKFTAVLSQLRRVGDDQRAAETLFWLGYCAEKQLAASQARRYYEQVVAEYPNARAASLAQERLKSMPVEAPRQGDWGTSIGTDPARSRSAFAKASAFKSYGGQVAARREIRVIRVVRRTIEANRP